MIRVIVAGSSQRDSKRDSKSNSKKSKAKSSKGKKSKKKTKAELLAEQEEKERFSVLLEDIDQFATKADSILDKFQRSDENWFYRSLVKLMK